MLLLLQCRTAGRGSVVSRVCVLCRGGVHEKVLSRAEQALKRQFLSRGRSGQVRDDQVEVARTITIPPRAGPTGGGGRSVEHLFPPVEAEDVVDGRTGLLASPKSAEHSAHSAPSGRGPGRCRSSIPITHRAEQVSSTHHRFRLQLRHLGQVLLELGVVDRGKGLVVLPAHLAADVGRATAEA